MEKLIDLLTEENLIPIVEKYDGDHDLFLGKFIEKKYIKCINTLISKNTIGFYCAVKAFFGNNNLETIKLLSGEEDPNVGRIKIFETLLKNNPDINVRYCDHYAIVKAIEKEYVEIIELLLKYPGIWIDEKHISLALKKQNLEILKLFYCDTRITFTSGQGNTTIVLASQQDHTVFLDLLLKNDKFNLHGYTDVIKPAFCDKNIASVKLLLSNPKIDTILGNNEIIRYTLANGHFEIVKLLLTHPKVKFNLNNDDIKSKLRENNIPFPESEEKATPTQSKEEAIKQILTLFELHGISKIDTSKNIISFKI